MAGERMAAGRNHSFLPERHWTAGRRRSTAVRATAGVLACEIALRKPYGGVIIYEPDKVTIEKLKYLALQADPNRRVQLVDPIDQAVDKVPHLLIPKYTTLKPGP